MENPIFLQCQQTRFFYIRTLYCSSHKIHVKKLLKLLAKFKEIKMKKLILMLSNLSHK